MLIRNLLVICFLVSAICIFSIESGIEPLQYRVRAMPNNPYGCDQNSMLILLQAVGGENIILTGSMFSAQIPEQSSVGDGFLEKSAKNLGYYCILLPTSHVR